MKKTEIRQRTKLRDMDLEEILDYGYSAAMIAGITIGAICGAILGIKESILAQVTIFKSIENIIIFAFTGTLMGFISTGIIMAIPLAIFIIGVMIYEEHIKRKEERQRRQLIESMDRGEYIENIEEKKEK